MRSATTHRLAVSLLGAVLGVNLVSACDTQINSTGVVDAPRIVAASEADITAVGVSPSELFWADASGGVWGCSRAERCSSVRAVTTLPDVRGITVHEGFLVLATASSLYACPLGGCASPTRLGGTVNGTALAGREAFTTEDGAILRCTLDRCGAPDRMLREVSCRSKEDCQDEEARCDSTRAACIGPPSVCNGDYGSDTTAGCPSSKGICDSSTKRCRRCSASDCPPPTFCSTGGSCARKDVGGECPRGMYFTNLECWFKRPANETCDFDKECFSPPDDVSGISTKCHEGACGGAAREVCSFNKNCASGWCNKTQGVCTDPTLQYAGRFAVVDGRVYFVRAGLVSCGTSERCTLRTMTQHRLGSSDPGTPPTAVALTILGSEPGALYFVDRRSSRIVKRCALPRCAEGEDVDIGALEGLPTARSMIFSEKYIYLFEELFGGTGKARAVRCPRSGCERFAPITLGAPSEPASILGEEAAFAVENGRLFWASRTIFGGRGHLLIESPED